MHFELCLRRVCDGMSMSTLPYYCVQKWYNKFLGDGITFCISVVQEREIVYISWNSIT